MTGLKKIIIARPPRLKLVEKHEPKPAGAAPHPFLNGLYDAVLLTDREGRITEFNRRAEDLLGFGGADFRRLNVLDLVEGGGAALLEKLHANVDEGRFSLLSGRCRRGDGTSVPVEIAVSGHRIGSADGLCFFIRGVAHRRDADERGRFLSELVHHVSLGIAAATPEGRIEYTNRAFRELWGLPPDADGRGLDLRALFTDPAAAAELLQAAAGHALCRRRLEAARADGATLAVEVTLTPSLDPAAPASGLVLTAQRAEFPPPATR